jgi:hypothetical protein
VEENPLIVYSQFMYHLLDASFRKTALICTGTDGVVDWDVLRPAMAALDEAYSASFTDDFEWDTVDEEDAPAAYDDYVDKVKEIVASHANGGRHENIATRVEDALKVKPNTLLLPLPCKSFVEILAERLRLAEHARFEVSTLRTFPLLLSGWPHMAEVSAMFSRGDLHAHSGGVRYVQVSGAGRTWRSPPPCAADQRT